MKLSIIVPLYNEEKNVRLLYESISREVDLLGHDYEILFVDDGSHDNTFDIARELASSNFRLRVIKFRRNYGQTPAMVAGIDHASGDILITMDGDLQNDPADIKNFIERIKGGYDIVVGWRHNRQDTLVTRKIPSKIANWLIGKVTGIPIKDNGCSLKAYRARVIKGVPLYSEMHRFIPAIVSMSGARIAEIKVRHHRRKYGTSKYGLSRIYKVLLDLIAIKTIVSFAARPLLWFAILAAPFGFIGIVALVSSVSSFLISASPLNVPIAGAGVLFSALSIILLFNGILGELIIKTADRSSHRLYSLTLRVFPSEESYHRPKQYLLRKRTIKSVPMSDFKKAGARGR
jgi:glycosyltransferase involved in cell wall biosynthesis